MESTPATEIISHMEANGLRELAPLRLKAVTQDVKYAVNGEGNWGDFRCRTTCATWCCSWRPSSCAGADPLRDPHRRAGRRRQGQATRWRMQLWKELNDRGLRTTSGVKNLSPRGARA